MVKDYANVGLPLTGHSEDWWILSSGQTPAEKFLWSTNPPVISVVDNSIIPSRGPSSNSLSNAILRAEEKQLNNLKIQIFPKLRETDTICPSSHLAPEHSRVIQTSFHLQPAFDHSGTVHSVWGFVFLPLPAHCLLLNHPLSISTPPRGRTRKKPLINSKKSIGILFNRLSWWRSGSIKMWSVSTLWASFIYDHSFLLG